MADRPRDGAQGAGVTAPETGAPGEDPGSLPDPAKKKEKGRSEVPGQVRALLGCTHPRQTLLMAVAIAVAALVSGRPLRESLVAGAAVLVVQAVLGIVNDARDGERDAASGATGNPVADGRIPAGNASFAA